jgi:hypothetical protein
MDTPTAAVSLYGPRPALAELPVDRLHVDPRYQRDTGSRRSQRSIARMVADFRWAKFGVVLAMPWPERDGYAILDGQHRTDAARQLGIETVPALLHEPMTPAAAAAIFVGVNMNRVAVHPMALHYASLAAGDETAREIDAICRTAGVAIARYPMAVTQMKPGEIYAVSTVRSALRTYGREHTTAALKLLAEVFVCEGGRIRREHITGLAHAFARRPDGDREQLRAYLSATSPEGLADTIDALRLTAGSAWAAVSDLAVDVMQPRPAPAVGMLPPREPAEAASRPRPPRAGTDSKPPADTRAAKARRCLRCGEMFNSTHAGNRMCTRCRPRAAGVEA